MAMKPKRYQLPQRAFVAAMLFIAGVATGIEEPWPYLAADSIAAFLLTFALYPPQAPEA